MEDASDAASDAGEAFGSLLLVTDPVDGPDAACGELPHPALVASKKKAVAAAG
jgi:hypothetical protein